MKPLLIALIATTIFSLSFGTAIEAGGIVEKFKIYGNCGMCKKRIEKALKVKGVKYVVWEEDTEMVTIKFDPSVITLDDLHKKAAEVGHDTDKVKAKKEVYDNLHFCCQYDRSLP